MNGSDHWEERSVEPGDFIVWPLCMFVMVNLLNMALGYTFLIAPPISILYVTSYATCIDKDDKDNKDTEVSIPTHASPTSFTSSDGPVAPIGNAICSIHSKALGL